MLKNRIVAFAGAVVLAAGLGFAGAQFASAETTAPQNKLCAKNNSRELTVFPGVCPEGTHFPAQLVAGDIYGLPTGGGGATGPAGPQGPKGDKGDKGDSAASAAKFIEAKATVAPGKTVEVELVQPAKSYLIGIDNDAPGGVTVTYAPAPVKGVYQPAAKTYTATIANTGAVDRTVSIWALVAAR